MMNITAEEKLMYDVMKAIYESGIPISFKGSMVLRVCLLEAGYSEDTRHTVDIDANWNSDTAPSAEQMIESLQKALNKSKIGLTVRLYRMYAERRSAGFELIDTSTGELRFTMDIDVNRPHCNTKIYELEEIKFCGVLPLQMTSDKLCVISSEKVFRRIKDVVDLYYISKVFEFDKEEILRTINENGRKLGDFEEFINEIENLKHCYEKFRFNGKIYKPPFEEVYETVKSYIKDILPEKRERKPEFQRLV